MEFRFNQNLCETFFKNRPNNNTFFDKHEKRIVTILTKSIYNENFNNIYRLIKIFIIKFESMLEDGYQKYDINDIINKLLYLYSDLSHEETIEKINTMGKNNHHGYFEKHTNMRDLILDIFVNVRNYFDRIYYNCSWTIEDMNIEIDYLIDHEIEDRAILGIVDNIIKKMYPQCDLWAGRPEGWNNLLDRLFPNHANLLYEINNKKYLNNKFYWWDVMNRYVPALEIPFDSDEWKIIHNRHYYSKIKWMGFVLKPGYDILLYKNKIFVIINYDYGYGHFHSFIYENYEWKYQPVYFVQY